MPKAKRAPKPTTNIKPEHQQAFDALRNPTYGNFCLFSCFVDGKPTSAISLVTIDGDGNYRLTLMFVAVTPEMVLTDHDGKRAAL